MPSGKNMHPPGDREGVQRPTHGAPPHGEARASIPARESARGQIRSAIVALHNFETLLRSPRVSTKLLREMAPELRASGEALEAAFAGEVADGRNVAEAASASVGKAPSVEAHGARDALARYVRARLEDLDAILTELAGRELDAKRRLAFERDVHRVARELDVVAELRELLERADAPPGSELDACALVRESMRISLGMLSLPEVDVRPAGDVGGVVLAADPHVAARLFAVAAADIAPMEAKATTLLLRTGAEPGAFRLERAETETRAAEAAPWRLRLLRRLPPTDVVLDAVASASGARLEVHGTSASLSFPSGSPRRP
jgi:hypothetical protein